MDPAAQTVPEQAVAIIGGATAGAEVAARLAEQGILVTVFEQNARPFGKIEDGLPRWHDKLRQKEYKRITAKLSTPGIDYVPLTALGRDVGFEELIGTGPGGGWGYTALVLANGAWRDRPLKLSRGPEPGDWIGRGFEYQNPFVIAFNHEHDARFEGRRIESPRGGGAVLGGGLAAIDVAKILNLEAARQALAERGIVESARDLEHEGLPSALERHDLEWSDLGLEAATIYYRRRVADMPVVVMPEGADAARRAKVEATRAKLVAKVRAKYLIEVEPLASPEALETDGERVCGLVLRRTTITDGRLVPTEETFHRPARLVVSSIGSIPVPIAGIQMQGELYDFDPKRPGNLAARSDVFAVGNVLNGKGNIASSRRHAIEITDAAIESYLGISDEPTGPASDPHQGPAGVSEAAAVVAGEILERTQTLAPLAPQTIQELRKRVAARQLKVGYAGDLAAWIDATAGPT